MEKYHKTTSLDSAEKNYFFIILTFSVQTDFFSGFLDHKSVKIKPR